MPWGTAQARLFIPLLEDRGQEIIWPHMLNDCTTLVCMCCSERWSRQNKIYMNCKIDTLRSTSLTHWWQDTWTIPWESVVLFIRSYTTDKETIYVFLLNKLCEIILRLTGILILPGTVKEKKKNPLKLNEQFWISSMVPSFYYNSHHFHKRKSHLEELTQ